MTYAVGNRLDPRARVGAPATRRSRWLALLPAAVVLVMGLAAPFIVDATQFPDAVRVSVRGARERCRRVGH